MRSTYLSIDVLLPPLKISFVVGKTRKIRFIKICKVIVIVGETICQLCPRMYFYTFNRFKT